MQGHYHCRFWLPTSSSTINTWTMVPMFTITTGTGQHREVTINEHKQQYCLQFRFRDPVTERNLQPDVRGVPNCEHQKPVSSDQCCHAAPVLQVVSCNWNRYGMGGHADLKNGICILGNNIINQKVCSENRLLCCV